ncbi:MAG: hypothetical protein R2838_05455 [Caldilineaceae bacterium]
MNRPTLSIAISSLSRQYRSACACQPMPASAPAAENGSAASATEAPAEESAARDSTWSNAPAAGSERRIRPTSPVAEGGRRSRGPARLQRPVRTRGGRQRRLGRVPARTGTATTAAFDIDVRERVIIHVIDDQERPVHDAEVEIRMAGRDVYNGRTDTAGRLIFLPLRSIRSASNRKMNIV